MFVAAIASAGLLLASCVLGAEEPLPSPPPLKATPDPVPAARRPRYYVVQVKVIEVNENGKETILGEPRLQTTGGNAGVSVDHPDGRRFEFMMRLTDRASANDDSMPPKPLSVNPEEMVLRKLEQRIDLNVQQQSRREILREVSRKVGVNIAIDPDSTKAIANDFDAPIDLIAKNEIVSDLINGLLKPWKMDYVVKHDVLLIASAEKLLPAPGDFIVKTYDVADLVKSTDEAGRETSNFGPLMERIKSSVQPASWDRKESFATIRPFNSTQSIVVRQTAYAHAAIERLLDRIRREQPRQIDE